MTLLPNPIRKVPKKFTKKFGNKFINRQYFHRKTGLKPHLGPNRIHIQNFQRLSQIQVQKSIHIQIFKRPCSTNASQRPNEAAAADYVAVKHNKAIKSFHPLLSTYSGIDVGPTFINFWNFFQALPILTSLIFCFCFQKGNSPKIKILAVKALHLIFFAKFSWPYVYYF